MTQQEKHTPGPWRLENGDLVGENGKIVCASPFGLHTRMAGHTDETKANASIFCAALDMLQTLEAAPIAESGESVNSFIKRFSEWNIARMEVIAKAKGGAV